MPKNRFLAGMIILAFVLSMTFVPPVQAAIAAPSDLTATALDATSVKLQWQDNSSDETGFNIQRRKGGTGAWKSLTSTAPANAEEFTDTGVEAMTTYEYRVVAVKAPAVGVPEFSDPSNAVTVTTPPAILVPMFGIPPIAPTNLEVTAVTSTTISMKWTDNATDETGYSVQRRKGGTGTWKSLADILPADTAAYTDSGLDPATVYEYRVCAIRVNPDGTSSISENSNTVGATTLSEEVVPSAPLAPTSLTAVPQSSSSIRLTWMDNATNEMGYTIERRIKDTGSMTVVATLGADVTSYADNGLTAGTTYEYRVFCYNNDGGDSGYSNIAEATTFSTGTPPAAETTTLVFYIGQTRYYVNGAVQNMEVAPFVTQDRTMLPIRYVAEPLGATVSWDGVSKVTIRSGSKTIELWIGQSTARVNGVSVPIDSSNPAVVPVIQDPGRTMLPLRFVAENLDSDVVYSAGPPEMVTVTYPAP